jgi:hypothetical protein
MARSSRRGWTGRPPDTGDSCKYYTLKNQSAAYRRRSVVLSLDQTLKLLLDLKMIPGNFNGVPSEEVLTSQKTWIFSTAVRTSTAAQKNWNRWGYDKQGKSVRIKDSFDRLTISHVLFTTRLAALRKMDRHTIVSPVLTKTSIVTPKKPLQWEQTFCDTFYSTVQVSAPSIHLPLECVTSHVQLRRM